MFALGNEMTEDKQMLFGNKTATGYSKIRQDIYKSHLRKLRMEFYEIYNVKVEPNANVKDFEFGTIIGTGAFGVVYLTKHTRTGRYFAMKVLEKDKLVKLKQVSHTLNEKKILMSNNFPFLVYMKYFFKDNVYLYFALPFVIGGDMFTHLKKKGKFDEGTAKFYASQVVLALEYLHSCDLIYRDLKPENILIERNGYIKITDFGFCKVIQGRTWTLCGTPEYMAPEVILSKGYGMSVDWWSLGVLIFEMCAGFPPFYALDPMGTYENIVAGKYKCPLHFSLEVKDLLSHVLEIDITRRFGNLREGTLDFKNHKWFMEIDWDGLLAYKVPAPIVPRYELPGDTSNFDSYETIKLKSSPFCLYEKQFVDF